VYTGSIYRDQGLLKHGFPGESVHNSTVIAIKTHEYGPETRRKYARAVLLVRNPFDTLLAEFNRQFGGHIGYAGPERFQQDNEKGWNRYVAVSSETWLTFHLDWLKFDGDLHILYYANLKNNLLAEVQNLARFLGHTMAPQIAACTARNSRGRFKREKYQLPFLPFTEQMIADIDRKKALVEEGIRKHMNASATVVL
ncbi:PREDICTED: WSCD family member AGAP003962-like, partial [Priapulus caudatus]|uniref:WSCD family member AGAP003962-like n=1 Tax=Priapulus caudatus TaxID=37621 RepID=A0ABM1F632_PRICU